jgi:uncharacterized protein YggE
MPRWPVHVEMERVDKLKAYAARRNMTLAEAIDHVLDLGFNRIRYIAKDMSRKNAAERKRLRAKRDRARAQRLANAVGREGFAVLKGGAA